MSHTSTEIQDAIDELIIDIGLWHEIVQGDAATTIPTESGSVPSVAKFYDDVTASIISGVLPGLYEHSHYTAAHTIVAADNRMTLHAASESYYSFTLNAPSSYQDVFFITIVNDKTTRRTDVVISGQTTRRLWPGQTIMIEKDVSNNAWVVTKEPGRWMVTADVTLYISDVSGSSANDGLSSSAPLTAAQGVRMLETDFDFSNGFHATLQALDGALNPGLEITEPLVGAIYFTLQGNTGNRGNVTMTVPSAQIGIYIKHRGFAKIKYITFGGSSQTAFVFADRNGGADLYQCEFGSGDSGNKIRAVNNGTIEFADVCYFSGNASTVLSTDQAGRIELSAFTHVLTTNINSTTAFAAATNGGQIIADPGGGFNLGAFSAAGVRGSVTANGILRSANGSASFYPGNSAVVTSGGGFYN